MTNSHVLMETSPLGRMWDLIVSVPDHCLSFYFTCHLLLSVLLESAQSQFIQSVGLIKVVKLINGEKGMIYDAYVFVF